MIWRILADLVVVTHAAFVGFVVFGLAAILVGVALEWNWVRSVRFRTAHLIAIGLVCMDALLGLMCPLTTFENWLRAMAGQARYPGDFIGYWAHRLIFYNAPLWVFRDAYMGFGVLVLLTFWLAPPQPRRRRDET
jgi:multisubunit Na+/H+ antiporter MnhB subunit